MFKDHRYTVYIVFSFFIIDIKLMIFSLLIFQMNGMSNKFWGWGREDDEFYLRMRDENLQVSSLFSSQHTLLFLPVDICIH